MITCGNKASHVSGQAEQHATTAAVRQCYANRYRRGLSLIEHAPEVPVTLTTFAKYQGTQRGNYCTLPSIDVEIVKRPPLCAYRGWGESRSETPCGKELVWFKEGSYGLGKHVHADGSTDHSAQSHGVCRYCGANGFDEISHHQHAYSDETECARCGGINGYGIGD